MTRGVLAAAAVVVLYARALWIWDRAHDHRAGGKQLAADGPCDHRL